MRGFLFLGTHHSDCMIWQKKPPHSEISESQSFRFTTRTNISFVIAVNWHLTVSPDFPGHNKNWILKRQYSPYSISSERMALLSKFSHILQLRALCDFPKKNQNFSNSDWKGSSIGRKRVKLHGLSPNQKWPGQDKGKRQWAYRQKNIRILKLIKGLVLTREEEPTL